VSGDGGHGGGGGGHKRRGHEEEHEEHENHERWLVSYADMMTLLMVLFIVMFAISQVDSKKFMALKTGLSAGFGAPVAILSGADQLLDVGGAVAPDSVNLNGSAGGKERNAQINPQPSEKQITELAKATQKAAVAQEVKNLAEAQKELQKALNKAGLPKGATFRFDERGLIVSIATDQVLFNNGDATLRPAGRRILDALTPTLTKLPNRLSIDGHTNSVPIDTPQFPSNWELAADRATGVLRYLMHAIPATRMSAAAFADTKPLKASSDPSALTVNRRVEIVVLANLDDSAGRAVAELGNKTIAASTTEATTDSTATGADSSGEAGSTPAPSSTDDTLWADPTAAAADNGDWTADGSTSTSADSGTAGTSEGEATPSPTATGAGDWAG
jgi:chemotaxis protein MotB